MQISRVELYELVSKSPLSKLAPNFGVSATTLAAICRQHGVPYPGSGYWTRKSLGQAVMLKPLPPAAESEDRSINIEPFKPRVQRPRVEVRKAVSEVLKPAEQIAVAMVTPLMVKERPTKPHPIIAKWVADHEKRRREAAASHDAWRIKTAPPPFSDIDHRRHRIIDALLRDLEAKGAKVSEAASGQLCVAIDGEKIEFQIREKKRQVKILPEDSRSSYFARDLVGTGKLVFAIRTYLRGPHDEEWRETDRNPLENQLPKIVDRLFEGARILKAWQIELEEEQERRRQEAVQQAERERLAKQEQSRRQKLSELARDWHTAGQIRNFLAELKSKAFDVDKDVHGKSVAEWMAWSEAIADRLDTTGDGAEGVFAIISNVKI